MAKTAWPTIDDLLKFYASAGLVTLNEPTDAETAADLQNELDAAVSAFEQDTGWKPFFSAPTQVQWLYLIGNPTGGSYSVTYGATESAAISTLTAAGLQAALEAISTIGAGNVTVTGSGTGPYTITLAASLSPYAFIAAADNNLTGGSSPQVLAGETPTAHDVTGPKFLHLKTGYTEIGAVFADAYMGNLGTFLPSTTHYTGRRWQDMAEYPITALQALAWGWGLGWNYYGGRQSVNVVGRRGFAQTIPDDAWGSVLRSAATGGLPAISAKKSRGANKWREGDVSEDYGSSGTAYSNLQTDWQKWADKRIRRYKWVRGA